MTSVVSFTGTLSGIGATSTLAEIETTFTPPSNISGKLCYVESTFFTWDFGTGITPTQNSRDAFYVSCNWAQPLSASVDSDVTKPTAPLAAQMNNNFYATGPVLCRIPNGPHPVRFSVYRPDKGYLNGASGDCILALTLKIVALDSRQPLIGV
jgi:hypothetical protein